MSSLQIYLWRLASYSDEPKKDDMLSLIATYCDGIYSDGKKDLLRRGYGDESYGNDMSSRKPIGTTFGTYRDDIFRP